MDDLQENYLLEILKKSSKTADRFTAISDLQNSEVHVYFKLGIGNSVESFQKDLIPNIFKKQLARFDSVEYKICGRYSKLNANLSVKANFAENICLVILLIL